MPPRIEASASRLWGRTRRSRAISPLYSYGASRGPRSLVSLVLADDPELERGGHAGRQPHRGLVLAERLDRRVELDPAVIDLDPRPLELVRDVPARDRA